MLECVGIKVISFHRAFAFQIGLLEVANTFHFSTNSHAG